MIIGVTGTLSAGKDEFSRYLSTKGFNHISLSDSLRDELKSRNEELTRVALQDVGNELRRKFGLGVLAKRAIDKIASGKSYVITSIRNPEEVLALKQLNNFHLVSLDAPIEIRFQRATSRNRECEAQTLEKFKMTEARELASHDPANQQLIFCMQLADKKIINDGSIELFHKKIDSLLENLRKSGN
jgi:dephospho-CoA kinase